MKLGNSVQAAKKKWDKACSCNSLHLRVFFLGFQVSEMFDVPSLLVNRRQADPHGLQFTEVHSGDQLWRDHQDAYQRTCTREKDIANPGVTSAALFFFFYHSNIPSSLFYDSGFPADLETIVQSGSKWTKASKASVKILENKICHSSWFTPCLSMFTVVYTPLHRNTWTIMGDQVYSTSPSTRQTSLNLWVPCIHHQVTNFTRFNLMLAQNPRRLQVKASCTSFPPHFCLKTDREPPCPRGGVPLSTWHLLRHPAAEPQNSQDQGEGRPQPFTGKKMCDIVQASLELTPFFACILNK